MLLNKLLVADKWPNKFAIHGYIDYKNPIDFADKPLVSFLDWTAISKDFLFVIFLFNQNLIYPQTHRFWYI